MGHAVVAPCLGNDEVWVALVHHCFLSEKNKNMQAGHAQRAINEKLSMYHNASCTRGMVAVLNSAQRKVRIAQHVIVFRRPLCWLTAAKTSSIMKKDEICIQFNERRVT